MQLWQLSKISRLISGRIGLLLVLSLSVTLLPSCLSSPPPKPFSSEALPTEAIAEISEIRSYPVRVKYLNSSVARPATVGIPLKVDETISTDENSTAQVSLRNGAIVRIGGKSSLTLKPQNQVEFISGRLLTWAEGEKKATARILTNFGEVFSENGTVYIDIPVKAAEERLIIALDGKVNVLLKASSETLILNKGEEVTVKADGTASKPKRIEKENIDKRLANNNLIFGFSTQLSNLNQIAAEFGITASVKAASTIEFRRSDLPKLPTDNNQKKITYTSGSVNKERETPRNDRPVDRRDSKPEEPERKPEEPTAARNNQGSPEPTTPVPSPDIVPVVENPTTSEPVSPEPPPQPVPIEPPPPPVQPEIAAPEPSPRPN
ncbi:MAG: hypothetical protein DCE90_17615 [Pseudanabaena sp.]|nr:MAG: hypothetical protein DCE90_17615 [Pseudanabaena sp.]